ncbi:aldo/keto reductase [Promicromonospora sp. NPDC019610]|uniref:aldo/keto reductase n=1 Tax=Promicromonospora sp. NPDC019610 TaxID=3364405 RepID=UPI0037B1160E
MRDLARRAVGSTGLRVTELGFGAASIGNLYRVTSDTEASGAVERAWERGIRSFDVAPHYGLGLAERRLGTVLRQYDRDEYVLSTKVGRLIEPNPHPTELDDDGFVVPGDLHRVWDFSADGVRRSIDESLERMGVDRIDIAYAHDPDQCGPDAARAGLESLRRLREEGLVRAIGIGTNSTSQLARLIEDGLIDVVMLAGRYTLLEQGALDSVLEPARRAGAAVVAVGVFYSGLLFRRGRVAGADYGYSAGPEELVAKAERIEAVCANHGVALAEAALAFPLTHPAVANVTLGMRTAQQVDTNMALAEATVPEQLWKELAEDGLVDERSVV